jgi:phytanoyl-CoA hydroxylase
MDTYWQGKPRIYTSSGGVTFPPQIKGLLPKDKVLDCRRKYFEFVAPCGILKEATAVVHESYCCADGRKYLPPGNIRPSLWPKDTKESDLYMELIYKAHAEHFYLQFTRIPKLREFVCKLTGWESEIMLTRTLLCPHPPNGEMTAVHYD